MPEITKIEEQKNKRRVNIFVDNAFFCGMLKETVIKNALKVGTQIDEQRLTKIALDSDTQSAFEKATDYLAGRMHTAKELSDKLIKKGYEKQAVSGAILKLKEYKYIDDELFAKEFVDQNRKMSKKMLESKLLSKGVDKAIVSHCLENFDGSAELELLKKQVEKYVNCHDVTNRSGKEKMIASFLRKGFTFDMIQKAIKSILTDSDDENAEFIDE